jgi:outer membrane protein assembly factor BamB/tetratricopeptide (TPR) repeat protein
VKTPSAAAAALAVHPVLAGGQVLAADARSVTAYDLLTGKAATWFDARGGRDDGPKPPAPPGVHHTLTVAEGHVFARLGAEAPAGPPPGKGPGEKQAAPASYLVCLRLQPAPGEDRVRWVVKPAEADAVFEGAPLVHEGRVYAAVVRSAEGRAVTAVHCYPAAAENREPAPLWRRDVCETRDPRPGEGRQRHSLLTLAGPHVVYDTHAGAAVALDALTGRRAWAVRYPGRAAGGVAAPPRDPAPCVYAGGRLYAAPADADRLLCLDPATGRTLWERDGVEVVHLLGVGRGRLIFTTPGGIRAVGAATGADAGGWSQPSTGRLPPFGRGFLAGEVVVWPVWRPEEVGVQRPGLWVLSQEDGQPVADVDPTSLRHVRPGNLAYNDGCLVVADAEHLWAHLPPARLLDRLRHDAAARPRSATAHYLLARAELDAGRHAQALASFERAVRLAEPSECRQGRPLKDLVRTGKQEAYFDQARRAQAEGKWEAATAALTLAAGEDFPVPDRLHALDRLADLWMAARNTARNADRAVEVWQSILLDDKLSRAEFRDGDGRRLTAWRYASGRIASAKFVVESDFDKVLGPRARALYAQSEDGKKAEILRQLVREHPNATVTREAYLQLARHDEQAGRFGAAAHTYRLALLRGDPRRRPDLLGRALILSGLARAYERQGCWDAAWDTWQELARMMGGATVPALDPVLTVREYVAWELRQQAYAALRGTPLPDLALPLNRAWNVLLKPGESYHVPRKPTAAAEPAVFGLRGREVTCWDAATGGRRWVQTLTHPPTWIGRYADIVVTAGPQGAHGLSLEDGQVRWSFTPEPLPPEPDGPASPPPRGAPLAWLLGKSLLFLQGERLLYAVDAVQGVDTWRRWAPSGQFGRSYGRFLAVHPLGEDRLLVQTADGKVWLLNEAGFIVQERKAASEPPELRPRDDRGWFGPRFHLAASSGPPPGPPRALDARRFGLVTDPRRVLAFDAEDGKEVWAHEVGGATTLSGEAPQLAGGKGVLLLLVARNYGRALQRLDPLTGKACWPEERLLGTDDLAAADLACDPTAVYYVSRNVLYARSTADGKPLWEAPLRGPAGRWRAVLARGVLCVYPVDVPAVWGRLDWLGLSAGVRITLPVEERPGVGFPVLLYDPPTGRLLQRLNFALPGPGWQPDVTRSGGLAVLPRLGVGRERGEEPFVSVSDRGLTVAVNGQVWALTPAKE